MTRATVAILRTKPERVLDDYARLFELGRGPESLDPSQVTVPFSPPGMLRAFFDQD